jgi:hypothetical protein
MNRTQINANALYAHMLESAEMRVVNGNKVNVWSGSLTKTCRELNIPKGTERRVIAPLEAMGCIQIIQRGAANYPSTVVLLKPPTEESWEDRSKGLTPRPSYAILSRRLEAVERTLGGVDLGEALLNLDRRLKTVEAKIAEKS